MKIMEPFEIPIRTENQRNIHSQRYVLVADLSSDTSILDRNRPIESYSTLSTQRKYSKRRKVDQIPNRERWTCPNEKCGKQYKRTSTLGIQQHKNSCVKKPVSKPCVILYPDSTPNTSTYLHRVTIPVIVLNQLITNMIQMRCMASDCESSNMITVGRNNLINNQSVHQAALQIRQPASGCIPPTPRLMCQTPIIFPLPLIPALPPAVSCSSQVDHLSLIHSATIMLRR